MISRVKARQVRESWPQQFEHTQVPNRGTEPDVRNVYTVKHFLFARSLFSRKFARPVTRENKVHANISHVSIIVQEMNNRENKVS